MRMECGIFHVPYEETADDRLRDLPENDKKAAVLKQQPFESVVLLKDHSAVDIAIFSGVMGSSRCHTPVAR